LNSAQPLDIKPFRSFLNFMWFDESCSLLEQYPIFPLFCGASVKSRVFFLLLSFSFLIQYKHKQSETNN